MTKLVKPAPEKKVTTLEVFTVRQAVEEIEVTLANGKKEKQWRFQDFHFTTNDSPVTVGGIQYIPLSTFDQVRWDLL
jgi:hypothetical protein